MSQPRIDILVQRQLDVIASGNGAYLETFLRAAKQAELKTRIIFAPWRSFGNRPWASVHPRILAVTDEVVWPSSIRIGGRYWSTSPRIWWRFGKRLVQEGLRRLGRSVTIKSYFGEPLDKPEAARLAGLSNQDTATITVAEYSSLGPVLELIEAPTVRAVLMHDVLADRGPVLRAGGIEPDFEEVSRETEAGWIKAADLSFYASRNEMQDFGALTPNSDRVWLRPEVPQFGTPPQKGAPRVVFIGTRHAGNTDSLIHFVEDIWPMVRKARPDAELHVAGAVGPDLPKAIQQAEGVHILGRVDSLADMGGPQSIGIAPTRLATGVSIKVAEYLLLGTACVAYRRALQGFGSELDDLVCTVEKPEAFAAEVIRLLEDDTAREALAAKAAAHARDRLDNAEVVSALRSAANDQAKRIAS